MAQIAIDIPDDLAQKLIPFQNQLSELFTQLVATPLLNQPSSGQSTVAPDLLSTSGVYQEILDFLISRPTSKQIIDFKVSEAAQNRLQVLLQKNRETTLTPSESTELDLYEQLDTLISFLKIRACTALNEASAN